MKLGISGRVYPTVIKSVLKGELEKRFSAAQVAEILKATDGEYAAVVERCPDIGDKNPFGSTLFIGAYAVALYKQVKGIMALCDLEEMIVQGLSGLDAVKKLIKQVDYLSPAYLEKAREQIKWLDAHQPQAGWAYHIEGVGGNALKLCYTKCGLCDLARREGVAEVMPLMCKTDALSYGLSGFEMTAEQTLAGGADQCVLKIVRGR